MSPIDLAEHKLARHETPTPPAASATQPRLIRGPALRKRWGGMPASTFYDRLQRGLIPRPVFPFGPASPYWLLEEIEAHEAKAAAARAVS